MGDFKYKDYTPEEGRIYDEAIKIIRTAIQDGSSLSEACDMAEVEDEGLKQFIEDDALKIAIAEMHYQKNIPMQQIADALKISLKRLNAANMEMLEDIGTTAAGLYRQNNPDGPIGNA